MPILHGKELNSILVIQNIKSLSVLSTYYNGFCAFVSLYTIMNCNVLPWLIFLHMDVLTISLNFPISVGTYLHCFHVPIEEPFERLQEVVTHHLLKLLVCLAKLLLCLANLDQRTACNTQQHIAMIRKGQYHTSILEKM